MGTATRDPGSFRDPSGYVLHYGDAIYRSLDLATFDRLNTFLASAIYRQLIDSADLLPVTVASDGEREQLARLEQRDDRHYLRQRRLGLISYPYEWSLADVARCRAMYPASSIRTGCTWPYTEGRKCLQHPVRDDRARPVAGLY